MKKLPMGGAFIRSMAAGLAVFACVSVAKAHPYASCLTNFMVSGSNAVSFYMNESGGNVTVTTYPSTTAFPLGTLPAGATNVVMPLGDTSYSISVTKTGTGTPTQTTPDVGWDIWNNGPTLRAVGVNYCAQYGDAFGRVYVAATGQTATDSNSPKFRAWGMYGLTPDLVNNAFLGGTNPIPAMGVLQSNTLTFTAIPALNATFVMDGATLTWTNNTVTSPTTQVQIGASAAASATNLAAALNLNQSLHEATISVTVSGSIVTLLQYAQTTTGASYFTYGNPANFGPFANDFNTGDAGFGSGPYRITVNPVDGSVWVTDATDGNAQIYVFGRNIDSTNQVWTVTGRLAGEAVLEHGNPLDVQIRGSFAQGNLQIFTGDNDLTVPQYFNNTNLGTMGNGGVGNFGGPQETQVGDANEIYRYDLTNQTSFPVTNTPSLACTLGLDGGFADSQVDSVALGPNTNYIYAAFRRANSSDGNVQVFNSVTGARVYDSLAGTPIVPTDIFATDSTGTEGCYGLKISPDGRFLAALYADSQVAVVNLTNGLPDTSSIFIITNGTPATTSRQMCWDAADNLYINNGTTFAREWSLGLTTTCVTSNDVTGTNGSFQIIVPPADVTVANNGNASQNYINESGTPITGNLNINLGVTSITSPVAVKIAISGTAANGTNYTIPLTTDANGVTFASNGASIYTVTFPGTGTFPGGGNWNANLQITPTASPLIGPTFTVTGTVQGGTNYIKGSPGSATVVISNTGPQLFFITAAQSGTTMSRAISNDYALFNITRWGDLEGPGAPGHAPATITLTNFTLAGTAVFPTDYTAGVQPFTGSAPVDGSASVAFPAGVSNLVAMVGNPVSHANALQAPVNKTIIPTLTNSVTTTNGTSQEGYTYYDTTAGTTLTEFDNAQGTLAEVVLWSDPLTNSSGNYAVTYAGGNMATSSVLPAYIPNYQYTNGGAPNGSGVNLGSPSNYFEVELGWPLTNENSYELNSGTLFNDSAYPNPPPSAVMANNGWSNVLRMTVDKQLGEAQTQCAVNFYPTANSFYGNYALRVDMYLSIWNGALNNLDPLAFPRNFAAFGIDTYGTNCDWRVNVPAGYVNANNPTNADGVWYAIDAADSSLTPADFDGFISPALPNNGTSDFVSSTAANENGVFKRPPFPTTDGAGSGTPINTWSSISVEQRQTNVAMIVDNTVIFPNLGLTNDATTAPNNTLLAPAGNWTNGVPMLGYLQPYPSQSDESAFVYFSNVRIVELGPYILNQLCSQLVLKGSTVTLPSVATYASQNMTNTWKSGTTAPSTVVATDPLTGTNFTAGGVSYYGTNDALVLNNVTAGNNYWAVWSDQAGSITSSVANVVVVTPPANQAVVAGAKATFTASTSAPTGVTVVTYQWQTNGVNLVNGNKYTNVATASLGVSNCQPADATITYSCAVSALTTNLVGIYLNTNYVLTLTTPGATLTIGTLPSGVVVSPASTNAEWGSPVTFDVTAGGGDASPFTYQWKHAGTNLSGATLTTFTVAAAKGTTAGSYTVGVTNDVGGVVSSAGVLTVTTPPPTLSGAVAIGGGNVALSFSSTNGFDASNDFTLQSSPTADGTYTNTPGTYTGSAGSFQVTAPQTTNTSMFYRLLHVP